MDFARAMGASSAIIDKVMRRTVNRTATWIRTRLGRQLSAETGLTLRAILTVLGVSPSRRGSNQNKDKVTAVLFLRRKSGQVSASNLGRARQTRTGVTVGKHRFDGAFVAERGGKRKVFKRRGDDRLPIYEPGIDIQAAFETVVGDLDVGQVISYMQRIFRRDLLFELERHGNR